MNTDANKKLVRRFIEEDLHSGDRAISERFVHPDFYDPTNPPSMQHGIEGHVQIVQLFLRSFPDVRWTITDLLAEGDRVCMRLTMTGTHRGEFFGIQPTGRTVSFDGYHVLTIADGKVKEHQGVNDDLGFMRQLGAIPVPATAG